MAYLKKVSDAKTDSGVGCTSSPSSPLYLPNPRHSCRLGISEGINKWLLADCSVAGWFKIAEDGLDSSGKWGVDRLISNGGVQTITIPQCIAPGQYLLRGELIALHSASSSGGAQFYMVSSLISSLHCLSSAALESILYVVMCADDV